MASKSTKSTKAPVEETEPENVPEEAEPEADESESAGKALDVVKSEIYIRQFNQTLHGKNFAELAKGFVEKMNGRLTKKGLPAAYKAVPESEVKNLEVRYREKEDAELHLDKQKPDAPMVDKIKVFSNKEAAVAFGNSKQNSTVIISKRAASEE